jgi:hypothetical protein
VCPRESTGSLATDPKGALILRLHGLIIGDLARTLDVPQCPVAEPSVVNRVPEGVDHTDRTAITIKGIAVCSVP